MKYKVKLFKEYIVEAKNREEALEKVKEFFRHYNTNMLYNEIKEINNELQKRTC